MFALPLSFIQFGLLCLIHHKKLSLSDIDMIANKIKVIEKLT